MSPAAPYAPWAHSHWVWLSSGGDRSNQTSVVQFAKEFLMRNISVGAVDCDSGWSTGFNNFVVDTTKVRAVGCGCGGGCGGGASVAVVLGSRHATVRAAHACYRMTVPAPLVPRCASSLTWALW